MKKANYSLHTDICACQSARRPSLQLLTNGLRVRCTVQLRTSQSCQRPTSRMQSRWTTAQVATQAGLRHAPKRAEVCRLRCSHTLPPLHSILKWSITLSTRRLYKPVSELAVLHNRLCGTVRQREECGSREYYRSAARSDVSCGPFFPCCPAGLGLPEKEEDQFVASKKILKLAELIRNAKSCVVLTGAGISTSAGVSDFRGPNGVWTAEKKGVPPPASKSFDNVQPTVTVSSSSPDKLQTRVLHLIFLLPSFCP